MEKTPVKTIPIHEHLRPRLCDTYENDSIFDKFEVVFSGDAKNVMTGSYNNNFMIYPSDNDKDTEVVLQADKSAFKAKKVGIPTPMNSSTSPTGSNTSKKGGSRAGSPAAGAVGQGQRMRKETDADQIDFNKKILHMSWHPFEDSIAIAATNNVSMSVPCHITVLTFHSFLSSPHCRGSLDSRTSPKNTCKQEHQLVGFLVIFTLPSSFQCWQQPARRR
jgi:serine/threonine-protein phosphatase 2A regulatory subunit B